MAKKTNIEINGNKYYRVTKTVGHKADGTPIRKTFYGSGINEANQKATEYMEKIKMGYNSSFDNIVNIDLIQNWLFNIKRLSVKPSTFVAYEGVYRNYLKNSSIASIKVADTKRTNIQEFYNELFENGKTSQKIKAIHKVLHSFFEFATTEGYLIKNPCSKVIIPKTFSSDENKKIDTFSEKEINYILEDFKDNKYELLIWIATYTGMREGEILALNYEDIHDNFIDVNKSLSRVKVFDKDGNGSYREMIQTPKTSNSIRKIPIPKILQEKLKNLNGSGRIFENSTHKSLYFQWQKVLKSDNRIKYRKFHSLRHSYATILLSKGADLKSVQDLMGHYDMRITQVYLHSIEETKQSVVSLFDY